MILFMLLVFVILILSGFCYFLYTKTKETIEINEAKQKQNEEIKNENEKLILEKNTLSAELNKINLDISSTRDTFEKLYDTMKRNESNLFEQAKKNADLDFQEYKKELEEEYQIIINDLLKESQFYLKEVKEYNFNLEQLKAKQEAYIKEQQHKEEMLNQKDYYRLVISNNDQSDIDLLREVQLKLGHKEAIDKIIWSVFYKPAYDILISHIFKDKKKVCGIYKITCLTSGKAYIGQSVDIQTRFKDHITAAISSAPSTNKLYQEMKKYQPSDFLFEILEEVDRSLLNERELYYIDLYQTKVYGLNVTKGNA